MIELPQIKHKTSGLVKRGVIWHIIYYQEGRMRTVSTRTHKISDACKQRDRFHQDKLEKGAAYKGDTSSVVQQAIDDPDGMACIYEQVSYRVIIGGKHIKTTTDVEAAKTARDEYIAENYE